MFKFYLYIFIIDIKKINKFNGIDIEQYGK